MTAQLIPADFRNAIHAVDQAFVDQAMADYPAFVASVPPHQLRRFAVQAATLAVQLAQGLDRHHPAVSELISHIAIDVRPAVWLAR